MPHFGHAPGWSWRTSGCIGQVKIVPSTATDTGGGEGGAIGASSARSYFAGSATNFALQPALQK